MIDIQFFKQYLNVKYVFTTKTYNFKKAPFYAFNKSLPSIEYVKENGVNCIGLLNLYCRNYKIKIKGRGGTKSWIKQFSYIYPINIKNIKKGTILFRPYMNDVDKDILVLFLKIIKLFMLHI